MVEYLPETETKTATLDYGEHLDIAFRPMNPGPIRIRSTARAEKDPLTGRPNPTSRTIELFEPGESEPFASETNHTAVTSFLETNVSQSDIESTSGDWIARVRNVEQESDTPVRQFELRVAYPGTVQLQTKEVSAQTLRTFLGAALNRLDIHVTSGRKKSYVRFTDPESTTGYAEHQFTVGDYRNRWLGVHEKVSDLNDRNVRLLSLQDSSSRYPNGAVAVRIEFEEEGTEITGTFHGDMIDPALEVTMGLEARDGTVSYNPASVSVVSSFRVNWHGIAHALERIIKQLHNFNGDIERRVEGATAHAFGTDEFRQLISTALTRTLQTEGVIPQNATVHVAKIENGTFVLKYATS